MHNIERSTSKPKIESLSPHHCIPKRLFIGESPTMPKMKGIFKSLKYLSSIFVVKENEMEIGYPTDVRHVAHIGWGSGSMDAPAWMSEFKTASDFSSASLGNFGQSRETSWASQDFDQTRGLPQQSNFEDCPRPEIPKVPKKPKRKKKRTSSPSSSTRSSRSISSYATAIEEAENTQCQHQII